METASRKSTVCLPGGTSSRAKPATWKSATSVPNGSNSRTILGPVPGCVPIEKYKKTRRGKQKSKKLYNQSTKTSKVMFEKSFDILHSNIRGYNSKKLSFKSIYQRINPSVITINEVGFKKDKKFR